MSSFKMGPFRAKREYRGCEVYTGEGQLSHADGQGVLVANWFDWGDESAGTHQLAAAMIGYLTDDPDLTKRTAYEFAEGILEGLRADVWEFGLMDLARWLKDWCQRNNYTPASFVLPRE